MKHLFTEYGVLINSGEWGGKLSEVAIAEMAAYAKEKGFGEAAVTYRIRDWGISRQRFWGAPVPVIYCDKCDMVPVPYEQLPVVLPDNAQFTGTGESPLAGVPEFVNTSCPNCGGPARRETDTMDTFVDSSWYFYRFADPAMAQPLSSTRRDFIRKSMLLSGAAVWELGRMLERGGVAGVGWLGVVLAVVVTGSFAVAGGPVAALAVAVTVAVRHTRPLILGVLIALGHSYSSCCGLMIAQSCIDWRWYFTYQ